MYCTKVLDALDHSSLVVRCSTHHRPADPLLKWRLSTVMPSSCKELRKSHLTTSRISRYLRPSNLRSLRPYPSTSPTDIPIHLTGAALAQCLQNSECILVSRHTPLECLSPPLLETLPTQCQQLKRGFGQCKRGMVDMRKRFRGNQPISVSHELEGGGPEQAGQVGGAQLYGGKPAFEPVKERSGVEPENQMDPEKTRGL
jgi:cytochrome c oxidase assembly factor 5